MPDHQPELAGTLRAQLGEGPCWDADSNRLVWVDIYGKKIHEFDPATGADTTLVLSGEPGCAVVSDTGDLVAAVGTELLAIDRSTGRSRPLAALAADPRLRFNDGKCDPAGRLWVGTMDREEREPLGCLYRVGADAEEITAMQTDVTVSNGLGWSPGGDRMYYIDSPTRKVWAYDFDLTEGELSNRRTLASFGEADGFPDGMAIDAEGRLWVAFWGGGAVRCLDPQTGAVLDHIELPASKVTSCAFGGTDLGDLYITTARVGLSTAQEPLAGRLFILQIEGLRGLVGEKFRMTK